MQRTGRRGHAQFRVIVQDSHFHPTRGRIVAYLGSYNPHDKSVQIDKELAARYLSNGAQPSERVAKLLQSEGVELPKWVTVSDPRNRTIRHPEKLRRNRPAEEVAAETPEAPSEVEAAPTEEPAAEPETPVEAPEAATEVPKAEAPAEEPAEEPKATEAPTDAAV